MTKQAILIILLVAVAANAEYTCNGNQEYVISFTCHWTPERHPNDFPFGDPNIPMSSAEFSPLCGTVHDADYILFEEHGNATLGIEEVAELGFCTILESEIDTCAVDGNCKKGSFFISPCDASGNPIGVSNGVCQTEVAIEVTPEFSYVSGVTMVAPSPDWFTGFHGVNLCQFDSYKGKYDWVDQYPEEGKQGLLGYDAGTDAGDTFLAEDMPLDPFIPITVFDELDFSNIFYNQEEKALFSLCQVVITKKTGYDGHSG